MFKVENTSFGKKVTIKVSGCSEFVYTWRNVRVINDDNPKEQKLINELEKEEKVVERKLLLLLWSMYNAFKRLDYSDYEIWEKHNKVDFNDYYHYQIKLLNDEVNSFSYEYSDRSNHGWCL